MSSPFRRLFWPHAPASVDGCNVVCHEWLSTLGGSDRVAAEIADAIDADYVFTLTADDELVAKLGIRAPVVECRLGRYVRKAQRWQLLLPLMPIIWRSLDVRRAATVVTSSHAFVNCVRGPAGRVVSYCHTPMRYAWDWRLERDRIPGPLQRVWPAVSALLRRCDRWASNGVHHYLANSEHVRGRIRRYYRRDSAVVHPPIDLDRWTPSREPRDTFVLYAGRLVSYKHPELAIEAARLAGVPIVVAGAGPLMAEIEARGDAHVTVVGSPADDELCDLYRRCSMLIFPAVEDFGMIPLEAQACGAPVVGVAAGGTLETVQQGETGLLVAEQTAAAFAAAIVTLRDEPFEVLPGATHRFSRERFVDEIRHAVATLETRR